MLLTVDGHRVQLNPTGVPEFLSQVVTAIHKLIDLDCEDQQLVYSPFFLFVVTRWFSTAAAGTFETLEIDFMTVITFFLRKNIRSNGNVLFH